MLKKTGLMDRTMDQYVRNKLKVTDENEVNLLVKMSILTCTRPESSEIAITMLLKWGAFAREPLCHKLADLVMPQHYFYGERDWMSKDKVV